MVPLWYYARRHRQDRHWQEAIQLEIHGIANGLPDGNPGRIETFQAVHIDPEEIRRHALPVERVDAAHLAEEVPGRARVELVLGQELLALEQPEPAFVDLDHQGVLLPADGAVAPGQLGEVRLDLEADGAAMAAAGITLERTFMLSGKSSLATDLAGHAPTSRTG